MLDANPDTNRSRTLARVVMRQFRCSQTCAVLVAVGVGMGVAFCALVTNLPLAYVVPGFFGAIGATIGVLGGDATYVLTEPGIRVLWRSLAAEWAGWPARERFVPWSDVRGFRHDRDPARALHEVESLEIEVAGRPRHLHVSNRQDPLGFRAFRDAFLVRATAREDQPSSRSPQPLSARP